MALDIEDKDASRVSKLTEIVFKKIMSLDFPDTTKYKPDLSGCIEFEDRIMTYKEYVKERLEVEKAMKKGEFERKGKFD